MAIYGCVVFTCSSLLASFIHLLHRHIYSKGKMFETSVFDLVDLILLSNNDRVQIPIRKI